MIVLLAVAGLGFPPIAVAQDVARSEASDTMRLGLRGVYFVPNHGQWSDAGVHYGLRSRGLDVAFRESAFTMHMSRDRKDAPAPCLDAMPAGGGDSLDDRAEYEDLTLTVTFPGSNHVLPEGGNPQAAKFNYFVGDEGRNAASNVPSFGSVVYHNLYDGIDLVVVGSIDGILKYEFHVAPGADYSRIRISYVGVNALCVNMRGDLCIDTAFGALLDKGPVAWQSGDPERRGIPARFELCDDHTYRFVLCGSAARREGIVIDPELQWMYFLGGTANDAGYYGNGAIAVDSAGNSFVTGYTDSTDFQGRINSYHSGADGDAFVVKVLSTGQIAWMTYLGGSGFDWGAGIATDSAGEVLVTGHTASSDFEGRSNTSHGGAEVFVCKVNAAGTLRWMTFLGGGSDESPGAIAVDQNDDAIVTGGTASLDFEGHINSSHGSYDGFVCKVSSVGAIQWSAYVGGGGFDSSSSIALVPSGDMLLTGSTDSTDFEGRNNSYHGLFPDAFACKVSSTGVILWMTYLGGTQPDRGEGIAADGAGNVLVSGTTSSTDFDGRNNAYHGNSGVQEAFVLKVDSAGMLQWMTYIGGNGFDYGYSIAADAVGNALVGGATGSTDFEGHNNAFHGNSDAFVCKVGSEGFVRWMTYLGGTGNDVGHGIAVTADGDALLTGGTHSGGFEGHRNTYHGGNGDAFIARLSIEDGPELAVTPSCPSGGPIQISWSGATGGGTIALLYSRSTGSFRIPNGNPCAGTQLGLGSNQIQIAYQGSAGQSGSRTVNSNAGPAACGGYLQLLDLAICATSNVASIE